MKRPLLLLALSVVMLGSPERLKAAAPACKPDTSFLYRKPAKVPFHDYVVDSAGLIPAKDRAHMRRELRKLFADRKRELIIVTIRTMDDLEGAQAVFDSFRSRTVSPVILVVTPYPNMYLTVPENMLQNVGPVRERIRTHIHGEKCLSDAIVKSCQELVGFLDH